MLREAICLANGFSVQLGVHLWEKKKWCAFMGKSGVNVYPEKLKKDTLAVSTGGLGIGWVIRHSVPKKHVSSEPS